MTLTSKVRRRMYKKTLRELRSAKVKSHETLAKLNFTVDLVGRVQIFMFAPYPLLQNLCFESEIETNLTKSNKNFQFPSPFHNYAWD